MSNETAIRNKRTVGIGSVYAASGNADLVAYAIGSCIALCLYDPVSGVGAMAHILLPSGSFTGHENDAIDINTKYADHALSAALAQMRSLGAKRSHLRAAIVGGAKMFPHGNMKALNIGEMNIASVSLELAQNCIPLDFSVTGGEKSRTVSFHIPGKSFAEQITITSPRM